jgi:hypothetical protein
MSIDKIFELGKIVYEFQMSKSDTGELIRVLGGNDTEEVDLQKFGKYWSSNPFDRPDGLLVVTSHRLVFLTKQKTITTTTNFLSFPLEMIEELEVARVMLISPAIRFRVKGNLYTFTVLSKAVEVYEAIERNKARRT